MTMRVKWKEKAVMCGGDNHHEHRPIPMIFERKGRGFRIRPSQPDKISPTPGPIITSASWKREKIVIVAEHNKGAKEMLLHLRYG